MGSPNLLQRFIQFVDKEYERRIRAASEVVEYGMGHGHGHHAEPEATHSDVEEVEEDENAAEIVNVPRGTRLTQRR